jgi:hypothetical protein
LVAGPLGMAALLEMAASETSRRAATIAAVTLIVLATCVHLAYFFPRVVDDLFISLRYAENLARGWGAVYNRGERVEGYSSPLFMLLESVGFRLHVEGVTWTKLLGVFFLACLLVGLHRLARDVLRVRGWLAFVPVVFCVANSYVVSWSVLGLETPLHLAAVVWTPVVVHRFLERPRARGRLEVIVALAALGLTRPESVLYVALNVLAPLVASRPARPVGETLRTLLPVAAASSAALGLFVGVRWLYYGQVVANTYFVKGRGVGFDLARLAPLAAEGATWSEGVVYWGGAALLLAFGWSRGVLAPALSIAACCVFTSSVIVDWMPSLRHLLPVTVLAPLGWACLLESLLGRPAALPGRRALAVVPLAVLIHAAISVAGLDNRFSPEEKRDRGWLLVKSRRRWKDALLAYRRVEPPHVSAMDDYEMGQITQAWGVLETGAEPVSDGWFVGRDIGALGYFTGVRVFDTAGLFTEAVSRSPAWSRRRDVDDELIRTAMALRPLAGEIYEGWQLALGRNQDLLRGYRIRAGSPEAPVAFVATDRVPPSGPEILARYRALLRRFPRLYHLQTLYGEAVGAAAERRLQIIERQLASR